MNKVLGFAKVVDRMAVAFRHYWVSTPVGVLARRVYAVSRGQASLDWFADTFEVLAEQDSYCWPCSVTRPSLWEEDGVLVSSHETGGSRYAWEIRTTPEGARIEIAVQRPAGVAGRFLAEFDNRGSLLRWWLRPGDDGVVVEERHAEMLSWVAQDAAGEAIQSEVFAAAKNLVTTAPPSGWEEIGEEIEQRLAA